MCLRNLLKRRIRTFLCILGVTLSLMLVTGLGLILMNYTSIIRGMNTFYQGKVVVVSRGSIFIQAIPIGSILSETVVDEIGQRVEGVKSAIPMLMIIDLSATYTFAPLNISVGIPEGNWSILVGSTPLKPGSRWPQFLNSTNREVVIGSYLAELNYLKVDSKIKIKNHELTVVGILNSPSAFLSRVIIMPLKVAQELYRYPKMINLVVVEPKEEISEDQLIDRLESEIPSIKALTEEERNTFVEQFFRDIEVWNMGIGSVLFAISLVLVTTITLINVSERRKEIATLYAIGAPKGFVIRALTLETGLIGLFGGLLGITFGIIVAILIICFYGNIPVTYLLQNLPEIVFPLIAPLVIFKFLVVTVALCFFGGLIPALATTRMNIIENLRSEY